MNRIKLMVNGLPGNMASNVVKHALDDNRFVLITQSLTGPEITDTKTTVNGVAFGLIRPEARDQAI
jgi:4-hydroxy-tetrahydrodipicolinate reductase